jgi:hypothetical protein
VKNDIAELPRRSVHIWKPWTVSHRICIDSVASYAKLWPESLSVVGVSDVTFTLWKRNPAFMAEIGGAINERLMMRLKRIEAGENGWQGCGWLLERSLPPQWAKPEVLIAVQNNLNFSGAGGVAL